MQTIAAQYEGLEGSIEEVSNNTRSTITFVYGATTNRFGESLTPVTIDYADLESEEELRERLQRHIDAYFANR